MLKSFVKRLVFSLIVLATITTVAFSAGTGAITGVVVDKENGFPLTGVTIRLTDQSYGSYSKTNGKFALLNIPAGEYELKATYIGYQTFTQKVSVKEGKTTSLKIELLVGYVRGEEIIVIGETMKGQAEALNTQRTNSNVTNVIAADQMGKFPDANIGDALKRVPGITVQNDQGEARFGLVRGTAGQFNSVTLNGERIPSAEAEIRVVQLDLIPADMIQEVQVSKTLTPGQDADAIGGSINLKTRTAPSETRFSATLAGGYNPIRSAPLGSGSFVAGTRFFDDKFGVIASASLYDTKYGSDNIEAEWDLDENGNAYTNEQQVRRYDIQRQRQSYSAGLDYQISDNHNVNLSFMYNHRNDWENRYRTVYKMDAPDADGVSATEFQRQTKGGVEDNKYARLEDQRTMNLSLAGDNLFFSKLKTDWNVTYAKASEERPNERYITWRNKKATVVSNITDTKYPSIASSSGTDDTDLTLKAIEEQWQSTEDEDINAKLNFELPLMNGDYKNTVKFGGRVRNKNKTRDNKYFEYTPTSGFENMTASEIKDMDVSNFSAGEQYTNGDFTTKQYLGDLDLKNTDLFEEEDMVADYMPQNYDATENIVAGFAVLEQHLGEKFMVLAGVRLENTSIDYNAWQYNDDTEEVAPTNGNDSYLNILPNVQFKYDLTDKIVLRAAWTNSIARPNYYDLAPYRAIKFEDNELELGNPNLKPTESMNFDFMAEYYMTSVGAITGGVFYKDMDNFIFDYTEKNYTENDHIWKKYTQPMNGAKAALYGAEVSYQRKFDFLPGFWSGFGIYANYTYTQSSVDGLPMERADVDELGLPGTCQNMVNGSLFFEKYGLNLRVSMNYATDYIDELGSESFYDRYYDSQLFVDVNASYAINANFTIFVDAVNLTDQPLRYYQGSRDRTMQMEYYAQRVTAGVKYNF